TVSVVDNSDVPVDGNACTNDVCTNGVPSNPPTTAGTSCGGSNICDGAGHCTGCLMDSDCPGAITECAHPPCNAGTCGFPCAMAGTPVASQTAGDCHRNDCDGAGNIVSDVDNSDVPNDSNACTTDICTAGVPSHNNVVCAPGADACHPGICNPSNGS